jgi:hypothetical protein
MGVGTRNTAEAAMACPPEFAQHAQRVSQGSSDKVSTILHEMLAYLAFSDNSPQKLSFFLWNMFVLS